MSERLWSNASLRSALIGAGLVAALLIGVGVASSVMHSRALMIRDVEIEGVSNLSQEEVLAIAGLDRPRSSLELDAASMEEMLRQNPWVEGVTVDRTSRDRIHVQILEAIPRAVIAAPSLMLVNGQGRAITDVETIPDDLPLFTGVARPDPQWLQERGLPLTTAMSAELVDEDGNPPPLVVDGSIVARAVEVLDAWETTALGARFPVREMGWSAEGGLTLWLASGLEIRLGDSLMVERLARVERVLQEHLPKDRVLVRIDARAPRTMSLRFAKEAEDVSVDGGTP